MPMEENNSNESKTPNLPNPEPLSANTQMTTSAEKPKSKKKMLIALVVIVLLAAGFAAYWLLLKEDKNESSQQTAQQSSETSNVADEIQKLGAPDTVPYAFQTDDSEPISIFWRPATGGERTEVGPLADKSYISQSAIHGQQVVYATENAAEGQAEQALWYSNDAGKSYSKLLELENGAQVTSLIFSTDGSKVLAAVLPVSAGKNTVKEIDVTTKTANDLFTNDNAGIFLTAYSVTKKQVMFFEGCYNCDGGSRTKLLKRDLASSTNSTIIDSGEKVFSGVVIRSDLAEAMVVESKLDPSDEGIPGPIAPHELKQIDLNSGNSKTISTENTSHFNNFGYLADGETPYYSVGKQVFSFKDEKSTTLYESTQDILGILYVSDATVIVANGNFEDFTLLSYDIAGKKSTNILKGDNNTTILGVTTK